MLCTVRHIGSNFKQGAIRQVLHAALHVFDLVYCTCAVRRMSQMSKKERMSEGVSFFCMYVCMYNGKGKEAS